MKKIMSLCLVLAVFACTFAPPAFAYSASTDVTVRTDDSLISVTVPTTIPAVLRADGSLIFPSSDAVTIKNQSVFAIHVANIKIVASDGISIASLKDLASATGDDTLSVNIAPDQGSGIDIADYVGGADQTSKEWNMGAVGSGEDTLNLSFSGSMKNIKTVPTSAKKAYDVLWVFKAGSL